MRKIFLDDLPRSKSGKTIKWTETAGYKIKFIYDEIEGEIEIIKSIKNTQSLIIAYNGVQFQIKQSILLNCALAKIVGKITKDFRVEIGQVFKNDKRDLTVIDREYREIKYKDGSVRNIKYYKYHCNKCNNEDWMTEDFLLKKECGCNVCNCAPKKAILGINTIYDKAKWMIDLGVSEEDSKKYFCNSKEKIIVKCPLCGREKEMRIASIYKNQSIGCICGDNISFPEKILNEVLEQLNIKFKNQLSSSTFKWCKKYRYDFYFEYNNEEYIIETNGSQHYVESGFRYSLEEIQEHDRDKKEIALKNGIKEENYIVLDCKESDLKYIKQSILNSRLNKLFDLNQIDWLKCEKFSLGNRTKEICDYYNKGYSFTKISEIFKISRRTVGKYLRKGNKVGWCNYSPKPRRKIKNIKVFKNNIFVGEFKSTKWLVSHFYELFGVKISYSALLKYLNKDEEFRGFKFKCFYKEGEEHGKENE